MKRAFTCASAAALLIAAAGLAQEKPNYSIDGARSKVEINVYKEGLFKAFGHDHVIAAKELSGQVQFDAEMIDQSTVRLKLPTKSITVIDPGESEKDRRDVQATMEGEKVLDVARFPEITFSSSHVSAVKRTQDGWELTLSGNLSLHGVKKPVSFPLRVHVEAAELYGEGDFSILQTDYGITPVKVGGGTVKVKDKLKISFIVVAQKQN
jgi:polyisoprenoid-binding protein YceI